MRLYEVVDPHPEIAKFAKQFADLYVALREQFVDCITRRFPEAEVLSDRIVFPYTGPPITEKAGSALTGSDLDIEQMQRFLWQWGARDIDIASNRLTWWDGRKMRIGRALQFISELSRRPDWREYELSRRKTWLERKGADPDTSRNLLDLPNRLPQPEALSRWTAALAQRAAPRHEREDRETASDPFAAVLTFDPVENAHRSARRGWTSCYDPERYEDPLDAWKRLACSLVRGDLVIWLTKRSDIETLARPVARTALSVRVGLDGGFHLEPQETYGSAGHSWRIFVERLVSALNRTCQPRGVIFEPGFPTAQGPKYRPAPSIPSGDLPPRASIPAGADCPALVRRFRALLLGEGGAAGGLGRIIGQPGYLGAFFEAIIHSSPCLREFVRVLSGDETFRWALVRTFERTAWPTGPFVRVLAMLFDGRRPPASSEPGIARLLSLYWADLRTVPEIVEAARRNRALLKRLIARHPDILGASSLVSTGNEEIGLGLTPEDRAKLWLHVARTTVTNVPHGPDDPEVARILATRLLPQLLDEESDRKSVALVLAFLDRFANAIPEETARALFLEAVSTLDTMPLPPFGPFRHTDGDIAPRLLSLALRLFRREELPPRLGEWIDLARSESPVLDTARMFARDDTELGDRQAITLLPYVSGEIIEKGARLEPDVLSWFFREAVRHGLPLPLVRIAITHGEQGIDSLKRTLARHPDWIAGNAIDLVREHGLRDLVQIGLLDVVRDGVAAAELVLGTPFVDPDLRLQALRRLHLDREGWRGFFTARPSHYYINTMFAAVRSGAPELVCELLDALEGNAQMDPVRFLRTGLGRLPVLFAEEHIEALRRVCPRHATQLEKAIRYTRGA